MTYHCDAPGDGLSDEVGSLLGGPEAVQVDNVLERKGDGRGRLVIADLACRWSGDGWPGAVPRGSDVGEHLGEPSSVRRTAAYLQVPGCQFGSFRLRPKRPFPGVWGWVERMLFGALQADSDAARALSGRYELLSMSSDFQPDHLFSRELISYFRRRPGWEVWGRGSRLLLLRPGGWCTYGERVRFVEEAPRILSLFEDASRRAVLSGASGAPVVESDAWEELERSSGLFGIAARTRLAVRRIPEEEVGGFLAQAPPRRVPGRIRAACPAQQVGLVCALAQMTGAVIGALGTVAVVLIAYVGPPTDVRPSAIWGPAVLLAVAGFAVMVLACRKPKRESVRLLRHGLLAEATVEEVETTSTEWPPQHRVRLRFRTAQGVERVESCRVRGGAVGARLRRSVGEGSAVRVLYEPLRPWKMFPVDQLAVEEAAD